MRRAIAVILLVSVVLPGGCDSTVTKRQLYAQNRQLRTATPLGQMVHTGSDDKYDYYQFQPGGQRYKVLKPQAVPSKPSTRLSGACGGPSGAPSLI